PRRPARPGTGEPPPGDEPGPQGLSALARQRRGLERSPPLLRRRRPRDALRARRRGAPSARREARQRRDAAAPRAARRAALLRRLVGRGDGGGPRDHAAHRRPRLESRADLAARRAGDRGVNEPAGSGTSRTVLRLGEAVLAAAGLDGDERETYLRDLAAADADLSAQVRRRLAAAEGLSDSFLAGPAAARLAAEPEEPEERAQGAALPAGERYELGKCLGEGGMGRVFLAFDRQLGRPVALKLLHHDDPAILRLFLGEARAQARVQHDHVLEIYDSGELLGRPFISMRYVAGGTLAEAGAHLSLERKVRLLIQVAEGLHAAHREGLLHRDVKPSNVLVERTPDGDLKALVTDFGLATEI